jgi:hypothetical protein
MLLVTHVFFENYNLELMRCRMKEQKTVRGCDKQ